MKTIKILLSVAGFAITGLCFGQLSPQNNEDVLYYTAYYKASNNSVEHYINPVPVRISEDAHIHAPLFSKTYYVPIEYDIPVEAWMTRPFESSYYEEDLQIESWMLSPFDCAYFEADPKVEPWMTRPFAISELIEEEIYVEDWMSTPWI